MENKEETLQQKIYENWISPERFKEFVGKLKGRLFHEVCETTEQRSKMFDVLKEEAGKELSEVKDGA